jgi:hypothetical protein
MAGNAADRGAGQGQQHDSLWATFGNVEETGCRWGHVTRLAGRGLNSRIHTGVTEPSGSHCRAVRYSGEQAHFVGDYFQVTFMSVNIWLQPLRCAGPTSPITGDTPD